MAIGSSAEDPTGTSYFLFVDENIHCEYDSIAIRRHFKIAARSGSSSQESQGCLLTLRKETRLLRGPYPVSHISGLNL